MPRFTRALTAVLLASAALTLAGCATTTSSAPTPSATKTAACEVKVVVNFGVLDHKATSSCAAAGAASAVLSEAKITLKGTDDYGDKVICRVNDEPSPTETVTIPGQTPFVESCHTLNAAAYWALWVKPANGGAWAYATEGVATLKLAAGESLGLVYTAGTDSTPPQD